MSTGSAADGPGTRITVSRDYRSKIFALPIRSAHPGSDLAGSRGCTCPIVENRRGQGLDVADDPRRRGFWIASDCVLHRRDLASPDLGPN